MFDMCENTVSKKQPGDQHARLQYQKHLAIHVREYSINKKLRHRRASMQYQKQVGGPCARMYVSDNPKAIEAIAQIDGVLVPREDFTKLVNYKDEPTRRNMMYVNEATKLGRGEPWGRMPQDPVEFQDFLNYVKQSAVKQAVAEKDREIAVLKAKNEQELAERMQRANADIESAKVAAVAELHGQAAELAANMAGKILGREISVQDQTSLVEESLAELGKMN